MLPIIPQEIQKLLPIKPTLRPQQLARNQKAWNNLMRIQKMKMMKMMVHKKIISRIANVIVLAHLDLPAKQVQSFCNNLFAKKLTS